MDLIAKIRLFRTKEKPSQSLYLQGFEDYRPQQFLYFFPEPHGSLYSGFWELLGALGALIRLSVALGSTP